jgi:hypothetical protein
MKVPYMLSWYTLNCVGWLPPESYCGTHTVEGSTLPQGGPWTLSDEVEAAVLVVDVWDCVVQVSVLVVFRSALKVAKNDAETDASTENVCE